jgi:hypothetical protein
MAKRADDVAHHIERGADQQLELLVSLVGGGEESGQEVREELIGDCGDLRDATGLWVRDRPAQPKRLMISRRARSGGGA